MKNKWGSIILGVLALVASVVCVYMLIFNVEDTKLIDKEKEIEKKEMLLYKIIYNDDYIPGSEYSISIFDDRFEVDVTNFCSALDCESTKEKTKIFEYSKENMDKLIEFVSNDLNLDTNEEHEIYLSELNNYERDVLECLTLNEYLFEVAVEKYKYTFSYGANDEEEYHFYFKEDDSILVKKLKIKDYDIVGIVSYEIEFSKKNMKKLFNYARELTKLNNGESFYKSGTLYKNEKNIYLSLIANDESYLSLKEVDLLYEITYNGVNCHTPYVRLYSDNTYEYFYTFTVGNKAPTPREDSYNYDIENIINSIDLYEKNDRGPFTIKKSNGKSYITYDTNVYLNEFLTTYNLNLQTCVIQEE